MSKSMPTMSRFSFKANVFPLNGCLFEELIDLPICREFVREFLQLVVLFLAFNYSDVMVVLLTQLAHDLKSP